jgi:ZIP family zinc transporter
MSIIFISILTCVFTLLGGFFALRYKDKLHLIIGFSAGAILGVAFFDLIPEAIELAGDSFETKYIVSLVAFGFLLYMLVDRFVISHNHKAGEYCECESDEDCECCGDHDHDESDPEPEDNQKRKGILGATSLSFHSFLDGLSIGIAFQVSHSVGIIVAVAVLIHDFADGLNTVNMILKNNGERKLALKWLAVDSIAPVLGVISTLFFTIPKTALGLILALFAGFFIYIASSNMIPESHHSHSTKWTTIMTIFGAIVLYVAITLAGI